MQTTPSPTQLKIIAQHLNKKTNPKNIARKVVVAAAKKEVNFQLRKK